MNEFFYNSWISLLSFVIPGAILGAIYDIFRVLRISRSSSDTLKGGIYDKLRPKKHIKFFPEGYKPLKIADGLIVFIEDICFWLIAAAVLTVYIYYVGRGEARFEYFLFALLGFLAYRESIGRAVTFLSRQIIFFCRCLIFWILYIIIYPIKVVICAIFRLLRSLCLKIADICDEKRSERRKKRILRSACRGFENYM